MIGTILIQAFLSFTIIYIVHYLYNYFRDTLTTRRVLDYVEQPKKEYRDIYKTIYASSSGAGNAGSATGLSSNNDTSTSLHTPPPASTKDKERMKNELKQYMKTLSASKSKDTLTLKSQDQKGQTHALGGTPGGGNMMHPSSLATYSSVPPPSGQSNSTKGTLREPVAFGDAGSGDNAPIGEDGIQSFSTGAFGGGDFSTGFSTF